jgi:hypothetical protein
MEREEKRLEQFRQLRKEIRGSENYLVVGIDISKDTHNAFMRTALGKMLYRRLIFNNTREGFETLLMQVEAVRVQHGLKEVVFGMEPTANYHKPLGEFLINQEQQVVLVSPEAVKHNRPLLEWALEQARWERLRQHCRPDVPREVLILRVPVFGAARSAQLVIAQQKAQEARTGTTAAHPQSSGGAVLSRDGSVLSLGSAGGIGAGAVVFGSGGDGQAQ